MASNNSALKLADKPGCHLGSDCQACQLHVARHSGEEDCLMEAIRSQWPEPFGNTTYCQHPAAQQFVHFVNLHLG